MVPYYYFHILANVIIKNYFNDSYCLFIFTDDMNTFHYDGNKAVVYFSFPNNTLKSNELFKHYGCNDIVIQTKSPGETLIQFERLIRLSQERFNFRKYLIIPGENEQEDTEIIFTLKELKYIADILVLSNEDRISSMDDTKIFLKTHKYIGHLNNDQIILLDVWFTANQSFLFNNNLYPDKISNQEGRPLRIATFTYKPYSIADSQTADGTEMKFALEYARIHNMTPDLVINYKGEWGDIYDNWTGTGLLGNLLMDKGDLGFAALYTWEHEYHFLDLSKPLVRTGITCLVPTPKLAGGWLLPLFSFSLPLWLGVALSFLLSTLALFLISYLAIASTFMKILNHDDNISNTEIKISLNEIFGESLLKITSIYLLQSISMKREVAKDRITRYLMACVLIVSLLIATSYSSGLASSMTIPRYENAIRTRQDLVDSGIHWGATSNAWITAIQPSQMGIFMALVRKFDIRDEETLRDLAKTGKFALSIERLPFGNFAIGSYIDRETRLIPMIEDLYWEQCVIMMRKNSILLPSVDTVVLRITQSGLLKYWESQVTWKYLDVEVQQTVRYMMNHYDTRTGPIKLKWTHVEGAFGVLTIGYLISVISFLLECFTKNHKGYPIPFTH